MGTPGDGLNGSGKATPPKHAKRSMKPAKTNKTRYSPHPSAPAAFSRFSGFHRPFCVFRWIGLGRLAGFGTFSGFHRPFCVFRWVCLGGGLVGLAFEGWIQDPCPKSINPKSKIQKLKLNHKHNMEFMTLW